jgi:gliding motility-associated-like protein
VISTGGSFLTWTNSFDPIGCMKPSLDGSRIALAHSGLDSINIFNFDNLTGILSNPMKFGDFNSYGPYGIEFSPDGNLLYVSTHLAGTNEVYQYDLQAGTQVDIKNSRIIVGYLIPFGAGGSLQIAPDNKIYIAQASTSALHVIENPNILGMGCNFVQSGFPLFGYSIFGLPLFASSYIKYDSLNHEDVNIEDLDQLQLPNVFTPNGDGLNDYFLFPSDGIGELKCQILNRWGNVVAEFNNPDSSWDGHDLYGNKCSEGTYFFKIIYTNDEGNTFQEHGHITLIR